MLKPPPANPGEKNKIIGLMLKPPPAPVEKRKIIHIMNHSRAGKLLVWTERILKSHVQAWKMLIWAGKVLVIHSIIQIWAGKVLVIQIIILLRAGKVLIIYIQAEITPPKTHGNPLGPAKLQSKQDWEYKKLQLHQEFSATKFIPALVECNLLRANSNIFNSQIRTNSDVSKLPTPSAHLGKSIESMEIDNLP